MDQDAQPPIACPGFRTGDGERSVAASLVPAAGKLTMPQSVGAAGLGSTEANFVVTFQDSLRDRPGVVADNPPCEPSSTGEAPQGMSMSHTEIRAILERGSVLAGLPDDALESIVKKGRSTRYAKGAAIYQRGDAGDSLMILLSGRVKITNVTADAREVALNFLGPGDLAGELAALDGGPRSANASALEATEALVIWRRDLLPVLEAHPKAMLEIIAALAAKVRSMSAALEQSGLQMAAKAAGALLRLAEQHGKVAPAGVVIDLGLSQRDLGNYAGLSRENMNRQLAALKDEGLIRVDAGEIVILDREALERTAEHAG